MRGDEGESVANPCNVEGVSKCVEVCTWKEERLHLTISAKLLPATYVLPASYCLSGVRGIA